MHEVSGPLGLSGSREYRPMVVPQEFEPGLDVSDWRGPWGYGGMFGYYSTDYGPQAIGMEVHYTPTEAIKQVGHRLYDPSIGRFLSRDPDESGRNWFSYCGNNPISKADPSGLNDRNAKSGTEGAVEWAGSATYTAGNVRDLYNRQKSFLPRLPRGTPDPLRDLLRDY